MIESNLSQVSNLPSKPVNQTSFKRPVFIIILVLVVLGLCALGYYFIQNNKKLVVNDVFVEQAEDGQLLEGFPEGLIIDKNAVIVASAENVSNTPGLRVFVTSYKTNLSLEQLEKGYTDFIKANGFNVVSNSSKEQGSLSIMAVSKDLSKSFSSFTVNSAKIFGEQGSIVMITFNIKK